MARKIVLILGLFVALLPHLGFPEAFDTVFYGVSGLLIAFLAWSGKRPVPASSIEEMEGELHEATKEEESTPTETPRIEPAVLQTKDIPKQKFSQDAPTIGGALVNDRTVSVAFAKHRSRNLKKRITQDESPLPM